MGLALSGTLSERSTAKLIVSGANISGVVGISTAFVDSPNVVVEFVGNFSDSLEVTGFDQDAGVGLGVLVTGQGDCALEGVANLPPIPGRSYRAGALVLIFEEAPSKLD